MDTTPIAKSMEAMSTMHKENECIYFTTYAIKSMHIESIQASKIIEMCEGVN
jgi:hypothetical protein